MLSNPNSMTSEMKLTLGEKSFLAPRPLRVNKKEEGELEQ